MLISLPVINNIPHSVKESICIRFLLLRNKLLDMRSACRSFLSHLFGVTMNEILILRPVQTEEEKTPQPVRKLTVIKRILQLLAA